MKTLKKSLIALLIVAVTLSLAAVIAVAVSTTQNGSLERLDALIAEVNAATTAKEKTEKLNAVHTYFNSNTFPDADVDAAQERVDRIDETVSDYTVKEAEERLAAVMQVTNTIEARVELNAIRSLVEGEGYISVASGAQKRLLDDVEVVDACVDLMYIDLDGVDLVDRGEVLLEFVNKRETTPLSTSSPYYPTYTVRYDAVVDRTIGLLYGKLEECLAVAEDGTKTEAERKEAVAEFRTFCERCYFDTAREEYIALTDRCAVADGRIYLLEIAAAPTLYEKGVILKAAATALAESGMANDGAEDADKTKFFTEHEAVKDALAAELYEEANRLLVLAVAEETEDRATPLAEYDKYVADCYFFTADDRFIALSGEKAGADAFVLLYAVRDAETIVEKNKSLKVLVVFLNKNTITDATPIAAAFNAAYNGTDGVYETVMSAFYTYMKTLTDALGSTEVAFDDARAAKSTILSLTEDGYFETTTARQTAYLADLAAAERGFGGRAVDWAASELRAAMEMTDTAAKKARVEDTVTAFESYGVTKYDAPETDEEIAFNEKYNTYAVARFYAELDVLADDAIVANDAGTEDLTEYFSAIKAHLATYFYDKTSDDFAAYQAKILPTRKAYGKYVLDIALGMCEAAEALTGGELLSAFNRLNAYYRAHEFYEDQNYFDFLDRLQALSEKAADVLLEIKAKLENEVPLSEYGEVVANAITFETGTVTGVGTSNNNRLFVDEEHGGSNSEKCMTLIYTEAKDMYYVWSIPNAATEQKVLEFDITTFGDMPKNLNFGTGASSKSKGRVFPSFFKLITTDGRTDLYTGNAKICLKKDVIQQGVWTHITMTYEPKTKLIQLYVDYEKAGEAYYEQNTGCIDWDLNEGLRLGSSNASGTVSFDNLRSYTGTVPRTPDRFTKMSTNDKFLIFGSYLERFASDPSSVSAVDVNYAYNQMTPLLSAYWSSTINDYIVEDPDLRHMVDVYRAADKESINASMSGIALDGLRDLYNALLSLDASIENVSARKAALDKIDLYITDNESSFNNASEEYLEIMETIEKERANIEVDSRVKNFSDAITRFRRAPSLAAMTRHYEACLEAYGDGFDEETIARFTELPALIEEFNGFSVDLAVKTMEANAKSIVECMRYVAEFDESEYEEKYEEINKYILIVRNLVTPNEDGSLKYKTGYLGVSSAVKLYEKVNDFFYQKLQLEHIEKLSVEINKYTSLDSYIEKLGVCIFIRNYVATNDVDETNPEIRRILESCAVYESELGLKDGEVDPSLPNYQLEKYKKLIEQNTEYFVDTVSRMALVDNYTELKDMYDSIMKIYYYMNIDSDRVQSALKAFAKYENILREMETHSELFIKAMEDYATAETASDKYKALSKAYSELTLGANEYYDGITDAMALYRTAAEAYNAKAETVNGELSSAVTVMCSARADYDGVKYLIAAFRKRYE